MEYKIKVNGVKPEDIHTLERKTKELEKLQEGQIIEGIVTGIQPYGAFVKFGEQLSGLVHIEDMSKSKIYGKINR